MKNYLEAIDHFFSILQEHQENAQHIEIAKNIFNEDRCILLTQSRFDFQFLVSEPEASENTYFQICFKPQNEHLVPKDKYEEGDDLRVIVEKNEKRPFSYDLSALMFLKNKFPTRHHFHNDEHMVYSREGMIDRVLGERKYKSQKESFRIEWADNIYGNHSVYNEKGQKYHVFLRDFKSETGYSDSPDSRKNKLGTTKHIMYAFDELKQNPHLQHQLKKECPFVEIYLDPLNENRITWFYPHELPQDVAPHIQEYFGERNYLPDELASSFLGFMEKVTEIEQPVIIRPEVQQKIDSWYEKEMMDWVKDNHEVPFESINATLYPYQKEGVKFVSYRSGSIIADQMGLGKTLQSITAAIAKKKIFSFRKTLIICPASLKSQWKKEIEKFSQETATIIEGNYEEREAQYMHSDDYFIITNYEAVLRDFVSISKAGIDFLILDEAQRIKNFQTKTWHAVSRLERKHILIITGTPIENKLVDIYSLMQLIDDQLLGPLWEFSYQHCLFDPERTNKITGYYDLHLVKEKLKPVLLRREKKDVLKELPEVNQMDVLLKLTQEQEDIHAGYAKILSKILRKKFLTPVDLTRITMLLANMRMVSNSTYLIDEDSNYSSKLTELEHVLLEKLDLKHTDSKIIIFSEWVKSHRLIGDLLRKHDIKFAELNGKVPVPKRGELIASFEKDPDCKVFLSTEAGGAGLNLQVADTLINFELPWNPAKKNQRIGRIDRMGQKSTHLRVLNFICVNSIESKIASGLSLKQNLFEGVLNKNNDTHFVDFSSKGRSQFLQELEQALEQLENTTNAEVSEDKQEVLIPDEQLEDHSSIEEMSDAPEEEMMDLVTSEAEDEEAATQKEVFEESENPSSGKGAGQKEAAEKMEEVMNQGVGFLAGLYEMATGQSIGLENQKVEVNKETGEVTLKFKLPGF